MVDPDLLSVMDESTLNGDYSFIDADTIRDAEGNSYRLQGFDAPEIAKYLGDKVKDATAGGSTATFDIMKLARENGFTNVVHLDEEAAHGRGTVELRNDKGESFTTALIRSGVLDPTAQTTKADLDALRVQELFGDEITNSYDGEFKQAAQDIENAMLKDGYDKARFKQQALSEAQYAANPEYFSAALQTDRTDIKLNGDATNPVSTAWDVGVESMIQSAYGFAHLMGDMTDSDFLQQVGSNGAQRYEAKMLEHGKILTDYKDVDSFGDAAEFLGTNLAMSLPYMGAIVAGTFAGPAGLAGVASLYAGGIYNEQPDDNKNIAAALAGGALQATLDRLGLDIILKAGPPKQMFKQAMTEMTKDGLMSKSQAQAILAQATKRELAEISGDAAKLARQQLEAKQMVMDGLKGMGRGTVGEGVTEAMQELIGYTAANAHTGQFDWNDAGDRMIHAAIAGGALGGAFGTAGTLMDKGQWADIAFKTDNASTDHESLASKLYKDEAKIMGGEDNVQTAEEIADETRAKAADMGDRAVELGTATDKAYTEGLSAYDELAKKDRSEMTFTDKLVGVAASFPALLKGHLNWAFKPEHLTKYRSIRKLEGMLGGKLQKVFSGQTFENFKHNVVTKYKNTVPDAKKFYDAVGAKSAKDRANFGREAYQVLQDASKNGRFNPDLIPKDYKHRDLVIKLARDMQRLGDDMHADQSAYNPELGYIDNYLFKYKSFDKGYIENNKALFIDKLTEINFGKKGKMSRADATAIADAILHNDQVNSLDEAFSVVKGIPLPGSHKKRSLGLSERKEFQQFMQQDIFANIDQAAKAAARYQGYEKYVGKNGRNIVQLLEEARAEGMPDAEVNKLGKQLKDYLDAESGNYKRPTTAQGKSLIKMQKNFIFFTTITSLASATISSMPELAMMFKGMTKEDIKGLRKDAEKAAAKMMKTMDAEAGNKSELDKLYESMKQEKSYGYEKLRDTGLLSWDVGAATTTGVTEISQGKQRMLETFFKYNGLSGYTDMTRAIRASFAGDFIFNNLSIVMNHPEGQVDTNEVQEAREQLRNIGLDISPQSRKRLHELMSKDPSLLTPEEELELGNKLRTATYNFVNDAIALPTAGNRPLFYSDPRFALFTQFQGFIATITANHIPKLWNEYIKRGSPQMKYNAFALMVTMIALGFVSQHIKDLLKYGGTTPHLDQAEYIRRGVESSGLLGVPQRITDTLFPMYASRSDSLPEWAWGQVTAQSPALSKGTDAVGAGGKIITGDVEGGLKDIGRLTAVPGKLRDFATGDWDFNGGQ